MTDSDDSCFDLNCPVGSTIVGWPHSRELETCIRKREHTTNEARTNGTVSDKFTRELKLEHPPLKSLSEAWAEREIALAHCSVCGVQWETDPESLADDECMCADCAEEDYLDSQMSEAERLGER